MDIVETGRVELGFGFEPEAQAALAFESLFIDEFMAIVPPDSALALGGRLVMDIRRGK